jgi:hypothetical protein
MLQGMQVEMCLLGENDLKAFAADAVDTPTREAIEAYLRDHPEAVARVDSYRRAAQRRKRWRVM